MAIIISIGKWGGMYFYRGYGTRLCLGWIAITYLPTDGDYILDAAAKYAEYLIDKNAGNHAVCAGNDETSRAK